MAENSDHVSFIRLTAQIVSAYLGNNSVPSAEIPALWQIYQAVPLIMNSEGIIR